MDNRIDTDELGAAQGPGAVARIAGQVSDQAGQMKDAVVDLGRRAIGGMDAQRTPAAATLDHTAVALHQQADKVAGVAHSAAEHFQATANYVRSHDLKAMGRDVQELVKRYPAQALIGAAVIGFVVARAARSRA